MSPLFDEAETQRRKQIHDRLMREQRAQFWARLRHKLSSGVRSIFIFLLGAAFVVLALSHWNEINSVAAQKASRVVERVKSKQQSNPLRQSALDYEKEVEDVAK